MQLAFKKMHGTGNDFVVMDARAQPLELSPEQARFIADRRLGVGCDTVVVLRHSEHADIAVQFFNADGSISGTCGNASRCIGHILSTETGREKVRIETAGGIVEALRTGELEVEVDMGSPKIEWQEIPLSESRNTLHLGLQDGMLMNPVAVNMGNPHAIFFVGDLQFVRMAESGPKLEHHPIFPQRANISAVQVLAPDHLKMQVWERGVGETLACGSAACAAVVAGVRREVCGRRARVDLPGGTLEIRFEQGEGNGRVHMRGPVAYVFEGTLSLL